MQQILGELHSHSAVQGIIMWVARGPSGCFTMCLTDGNFKNLATGDVVDRFLNQLSHADDAPGTTDSDGFFETSLYHGEYEARISHPRGDAVSGLKEFSVLPKEEDEERDTYRLTVNV